MTDTQKILDRAWEEYRAGLENVRNKIFSHPSAADETGAATGLYLFHQIQAVAFNIAIAARHESPRFSSHGIFEPSHYTWTSPGSDYLYRKAFVDGSRRYRVWGRRGTARMLLLQVMAGYWNDDPSKFGDLGNYEIGDFEIEEDGSFEIIVSATRVPGNWIRLDPDRRNICLMVREVFQDWDHETASELHIEPLDGCVALPPLDCGALAERIRGAVRFMDFTVSEWSAHLVDEAIRRGGCNKFADAELESTYSSASGINPVGGFYTAAYDVSDDRALIIEIRGVEAEYWGIQLSDRWHQNTNYIDHQSSLNSGQALADVDGVMRFVVSVRDPGVWNWLDPVGISQGGIDLRFLRATVAPEVDCKVVHHSEIKGHLPLTTRWVGVQERQIILKGRRRAALRRWGY